MDHLTEKDIDETILPKVYTQSYGKKQVIDGVVHMPLKNYVGEDGSLAEILKISEAGEVEQVQKFKIAQINSTMLTPGTIKGWHLHLRQNDLWYVMPTSHLIVCLWDVRRNSPTKGTVMRFALGGGSAQILFIPKGVAHGAANFSKHNAEVIYFVDQKFDSNNPDEKRIPWNSLGDDFWNPQKD